NVLRIKESITTGKLGIRLPAVDEDNLANRNYNEQIKKDEVDINPETRLFLQSLLADSKGELEKFKGLLENWFDDTMLRATGWYKRYTQYILFIIGFLIAVSFNVDTIAIARKLSTNPKLASQIANDATAFVEQQKKDAGDRLKQLQDRGDDTSAQYNSVKKDYDSLKKRTEDLTSSAKTFVNDNIRNANEVLGLGYRCNHPILFHTFFFLYPDVSTTNFIGWLITALAICLGAPFWFDLLSKLIRIRGSGGMKNESPQTTSAGVSAAVPAQNVNINTSSGEEAVG